MADAPSTWRSGASLSADPNASTSSTTNWGRGSSTATTSNPQSSKNKLNASRFKSGTTARSHKASNSATSSSVNASSCTTVGSNFKSGTNVKSTKFLPTQPLPYHSLQNIKDYYHGLLDSGLVKKSWLDNPKNPIQNYVLYRTNTYPIYTVEEGQVQGRRDINFRCTLHFDPEYDWTVYGDAKTPKDAERIAALHAVLFLQNSGDILTKTPTASVPAPLVPQQQGPVGKLSDGSELTVQRAREFIDFYCRRFNLGTPDIRQSAAKQGKPKRGAKASSSVTTQQPHASMYLAGNQIGAAVGKSKKQAVANCYIESVTYIESTDPSLWKTFSLLHKPGMPIQKAPHVLFDMSDELDDSVQNIYDTMIRSKIYAKRPCTLGVAIAGEDPNAASNNANDHIAKQRHQKQQRARRFNQQFGTTQDSLQRKSEQLELSLANYYSDDAMTNIRNQRLSLPVSQKQSDVLVKVELNQVTICMAATGSGKTTQIPQILFDDYILQGKGANCNIICTQPRRIAAISVAERVAKERGEKLGQTVGYQVRFEAKPPQPNGSITFCTTGVFLRRLQSALGDAESSNTFLDSITHVVIDEVHERDVETDLLLVVIKRLLAERSKLGKKEIKVVLMSATIDPTLFQNYFAHPNGSPAPVVEIPGRSFPVEKHYLEETVRNLEALRLTTQMGGWVWSEKNVRDYIEREIYQGGRSVSRHDNARGGPGGLHGSYDSHRNTIEEAVDPMADQVDSLEIPYPLVALIIAYVLSISNDGHVLVFLPGWEEIKAVNLLLTETQYHPLLRTDFNDRDQFEIHVLHSTIPVQDQQAVFEPVRHTGIRRIILATNIAETSITIPDVVYVVDTGRVKEKRFDPERHLSSLVSAWVGTSNLNQRAGRAGRHRAGEYFGVLSKARYDRLKVNQTVEMKRTDLSNVVMHIKALDIPGMEVEEVLASAIEPPAPERVLAAMEKLKMVGALDMHKNLTSLGRVLLQLPVDAPMGKMCLYGAFFRCLDPVLSLAAILTSRDPFMAPMHLREEAEMVKDRWCPPGFRSDALCILRAYTRWWEMQSQEDFAAANRFCQDNFLSKLTLLQIQQVKEHLFQSMEKADIISVIQSSSLNSNGHGHNYSRYRRAKETDAEFNLNAESTSLLAALIAVSSPPNFAIRSGKASYRTSQDKSCLMHSSSICHTKFTQHKPWDTANQGEKQIFAFSEKIRNVSGSAGSNAKTMLKGCTRLDPLTFMLFGATEVRVLGEGVECDYWLPITGNTGSLDNLEKLRSIMDVIMLRVFEGIGKRRNAQNQSRGDDEDEVGDEDEDEWGDRTDLSLSAQEIGEFEYMSQGIVHILDGYAQERGWASSSRGSTRPASPASFGFGGLSLQEPSRATPTSSSVYQAGSRGGSSTNLVVGGEMGSMASSNAGSRWASRSQTPDLRDTLTPSVAASSVTGATSATRETRATKAGSSSGSTTGTRASVAGDHDAAADGGRSGGGSSQADGPKCRRGGGRGGRGGRGGGRVSGGRGGRGGRGGSANADNSGDASAAPSS
ncbi:related to ATP-dependent RNA helicase [Melanopsichium pennsylvanicum]|uniref:Related to ATP-dependent RNA helicase n=2 Tax=Melanopsichium pennsylvanicum TaxID=63383 RepID=A0AAJ4XQH4_9BASI|nr:related to ATP-dependent RNA helicase [Melanopsichium pennsylvanicum]